MFFHLHLLTASTDDDAPALASIATSAQVTTTMTK
jgi:hypothetical protein